MTTFAISARLKASKKTDQKLATEWKTAKGVDRKAIARELARRGYRLRRGK